MGIVHGVLKPIKVMMAVMTKIHLVIILFTDFWKSSKAALIINPIDMGCNKDKALISPDQEK